jgi:hypothetical protein
MLQGSLELCSEIPTSNPNFILAGILIFLEFVIICAARLPVGRLNFDIISLKLIFNSLFSLFFISRKFSSENIFEPFSS